MGDKVQNVRTNVYINNKDAGRNLRDLQKESRKLRNEIASLTPGTNEYISASKRLREVSKTISNINSDIKGLNNSWRQAKQVFVGTLAAFTTAKLGQALSSGLNDAIQRINKFEKAIDNLSAITGAEGKELDYLKRKAVEFGRETSRTATEVVEAFKLVGSAKPELLQNGQALAAVTKEVITLSEAAEMELSDATRSVVNTMNQFSAGAEETSRYINVMAAGSKEGAAEITQIAESINRFGTVAGAANVSIEESVALVETLADKGEIGSEAGTKLRNVLLTLQTGADDTNPKIVGLQKALDNLAKKGLSSTEIMQMFGKENTVAAQILIENTSRVDELTNAITGTNVAYEQAAINTDNLTGDTTMLKGAWESFVLSLEDGQGPITNVFRGLVQGLTDAVNWMSYANKSVQELKAQAMDENLAWSIQQDKIEVEEQGKKLAEALGLGMKEGQKIYAQLLVKQYTQIINEGTAGNAEQLKKQVLELQKLIDAPADLKAGVNENQSGIGNGITTKRTEEEKKQIDKVKKAYEELNQTIADLKRDFEIRQMEADERELALLDDKYAKLRAKAGDNEKQLAEIERLHQEERAHVRNIQNQKVSEQAIAEEKKKHEAIRTLREKYGLITSEELLEEQKAILKKAMDEGLIAYEEYLKGLKILEEKYFQDNDPVKEAMNERVKQVENYADGIAAMSGIANNLMAIEMERSEVVRKSGESEESYTRRKEAEEQKRKEIAKKYAGIRLLTTVAEITAQTALAIMRVTSELGVLALPMQIAYGILGATQIALAKAQYNKVKSYAEGGYTGLGFGTPDQSGFKQAGIVHEGEYVIPKWMMQDQQVANITAMLENIRTSQGSFAEGGPTSTVIEKQAINNTTVLNQEEVVYLLKELIQKVDRPALAVFNDKVVRDINERINRDNVINNRSKLN